MNEEMLNISVQQSKLLSSALRVKIMKYLLDSPKTSKQVADLLGESGGNIHYHIKKLYDGGLLEIVEEKKNGGVTEKYYQSKSKWFNTEGAEIIDPVLSDQYESADATKLSIRLELTGAQKEQMTSEFRAFLERWVEKTTAERNEDTQEFSIGVKIISTEPKQEKKE
ncbi:transcriptional regulator [Paenibacillus sp. J45TS6]|uniref:ArsR/SmtB family transcription factor n=1 Tax=unclassified Paenibacillus TaxID=185978 RepID=UPI001B0DFA07|nr:helix-turn-helix domain-containing protein [Paenibacillus sp. J45TS6]GIP44967.1 transcriptional regulator [Paenibacillus sp. J45TS6]